MHGSVYQLDYVWILMILLHIFHVVIILTLPLPTPFIGHLLPEGQRKWSAVSQLALPCGVCADTKSIHGMLYDVCTVRLYEYTMYMYTYYMLIAICNSYILHHVHIAT